MKKRNLAWLLIVTLLLVGEISGFGEARGKVLLLPREGSSDTDYMLEKEIGVMIQMLTSAGYDYAVATVSGKLIKGFKHDLKVDLRINEVHLTDYSGLLMPCMAAGGVPSWHSSPDQIALIKAADALNLTMAAQASSIINIGRSWYLAWQEVCVLLGSNWA